MRTKILWKSLAVTTSVALVVTLIAGGFDRLMLRDSHPKALAGSKSRVLSSANASNPDVIEPSADAQKLEIQWTFDSPPDAPAVGGPTLMGGSKSATVIADRYFNAIVSKFKDK